MTWILIVFTAAWSGYSYPVVTMQEFNSKEACETAAKQIRNYGGAERNFKATCELKG
jgi:hypothetical protein